MATVSWQLELTDTQETESGSVTATVAQVVADGSGGSAAHSSPISRRSLGLLRVGIAVDKALDHWAKAVELLAAKAPSTQVGDQVNAAIDELELALARINAQIDEIDTDLADTAPSLTDAKTLVTNLLEVMKAGEM
jgi:ABC-type transporter Mla subunit MlaD